MSQIAEDFRAFMLFSTPAELPAPSPSTAESDFAAFCRFSTPAELPVQQEDQSLFTWDFDVAEEEPTAPPPSLDLEEIIRRREKIEAFVCFAEKDPLLLNQ